MKEILRSRIRTQSLENIILDLHTNFLKVLILS